MLQPIFWAERLNLNDFDLHWLQKSFICLFIFVHSDFCFWYCTFMGHFFWASWEAFRYIFWSIEHPWPWHRAAIFLQASPWTTFAHLTWLDFHKGNSFCFWVFAVEKVGFGLNLQVNISAFSVQVISWAVHLAILQAFPADFFTKVLYHIWVHSRALQSW